MLDPDKVRAYVRDRKELNVLLNNKEQFDDDEIAMFDMDSREELVLMFPALLAKKDAIHDLIILQGVIGKLMEAVAQQENRNQMTVGDDNVGQIDFSNKADKYFSIAQAYNNKMAKLAQTSVAASFYNDTWGYVNMDSGDMEFYMGGDN
jgi:hypothetical protein